MAFTQLIEVDGADAQALQDHVATWHAEQAGQAPGYLGARVLADQDTAGRHLILVDFSSQEEAEANSDREATSTWAAGLRDLASGDPTFRNLGVVWSTEG